MRGWILPAGLLLLVLGAAAALAAGDRAGGPAVDRAWIGLVGLAAALLLVIVIMSRRRRQNSEPALLVARDGALRRGAGADGADASRRRAVPVVVLGGQAAIAERLGRLSRVLTPGQHTLAPGEVIARVVNTTSRTLAGTVEASTKDGVPVTVEFQLEARVLTEAAPNSRGRERPRLARSRVAVAHRAAGAGCRGAGCQPPAKLGAVGAPRGQERLAGFAGTHLPRRIYDLLPAARTRTPLTPWPTRLARDSTTRRGPGA